VIHLAAYFDLESTPHPDYERVTVGGTRRLLRELQSFDVDQFVFATDFDAPLRKSTASALRGVQIPWTLALCTLRGAALMFTRLALAPSRPWPTAIIWSAH
jgi:hypothetical protein